MRSIKLKPILTTELTKITAKEFKTILPSKLFLSESVSKETVDRVITKNYFNEVIIKLLDLFIEVNTFSKRLQNMLDFEGFDPCIASQLLSAVSNKNQHLRT